MARRIVLELLAACDSGQTELLRRCTTPALFEALCPGQTAQGLPQAGGDILQLQIKVLQWHELPQETRLSVRVQGCSLLPDRLQLQHFDERWQLCRPDGGHHDWRVCSIEPQD